MHKEEIIEKIVSVGDWTKSELRRLPVADFNKLAKEYQLTYEGVISMNELEIDERRKWCIEQYNNGASMNEMSLRLSVSRTRVSQIIKRIRQLTPDVLASEEQRREARRQYNERKKAKLVSSIRNNLTK